MMTRWLAGPDPVDQLVDFRSAQATQTELVIAGVVGSSWSRMTGISRVYSAENSYSLSIILHAVGQRDMGIPPRRIVRSV